MREERLHFLRVLLDVRERVAAFREARVHEFVIGVKDFALVLSCISFKVNVAQAIDRGLTGRAETANWTHPRVIGFGAEVSAHQLEKGQGGMPHGLINLITNRNLWSFQRRLARPIKHELPALIAENII